MALVDGPADQHFADVTVASINSNPGDTQVDNVLLSTPARNTIWHNLHVFAIESADAFFSADGSTSNDPLLSIAQRDARAASTFIKSVNRLAIASTVLVVATCCVFLAVLWTQCEGCERPLRWWLLVFSMLQLSQVPTRIVFLTKVLTAESRQDSIESIIASMTASPAWHVSQNVSLLTYCWLVLGIVWVLNSGGCPDCSSLYWLTVVVLSQAIVRTVLTLHFFGVAFPDHARTTMGESSEIKAASPEEIASLPCIRHTSSLFSEDDMSCAVCLSQFSEGDSLRRLPCQHYFHRKCIDQWLRRSKRCPLCMGCIDAVKIKIDRTKQD
eukprot:gnl/TRDRNA2_/TRDRNA2_183136_c0_seq1.p1 gnl/TRDRNA2_/TRDRNA2_183136_c0~~gnl/TRDRNA2_/TRDRNA2_183136_c0_seq1.p1  ORF type:complete len:327 (+),score=28.56 gnl/TRDRNA2_/TRDRNA2_183136_c0_seq1:86-1066(+)